MDIKLTANHKNSELANKTLSWLDLDSQDLWIQNMQDRERSAQEFLKTLN